MSKKGVPKHYEEQLRMVQEPITSVQVSTYQEMEREANRRRAALRFLLVDVADSDSSWPQCDITNALKDLGITLTEQRRALRREQTDPECELRN